MTEPFRMPSDILAAGESVPPEVIRKMEEALVRIADADDTCDARLSYGDAYCDHKCSEIADEALPEGWDEHISPDYPMAYQDALEQMLAQAGTTMKDFADLVARIEARRLKP